MHKVFSIRALYNRKPPEVAQFVVQGSGGEGGASNFTLHFGDLGEMGLVSEVGKFAERDGKTVISQPRYCLTDRGRHLVSSHGPEFDPTPDDTEIDVDT